MSKNVSIIAIDFLNHELTKLAIEQTLRCIDPKEVIVVSDKDIYPGSIWVPCKSVKNYLMYNELMLKWIYPLIDTSHALYIQHDGLAINKNAWSDDYLKYDYIGAPWYHYPEGFQVGNGGFSLRSKKLLDACRDPAIIISEKGKWIANEDVLIGTTHKRYLEHTYQVKFAPVSIARIFSYESGQEPLHKPFGIHGLHNVLAIVPYYLDIIHLLKLDTCSLDKFILVLNALAATLRIDGIDLLITRLKNQKPEFLYLLAEVYSKNNTSELAKIILDKIIK